MGHPNYGKRFEDIIKESMLAVGDIDVQRLYDTTNGFTGISQPADYVVYKYPYQYYIECKCTWENTLHKDYITQLPKLLEKSNVPGVFAYVFIWFIKHDTTVAISAKELRHHFEDHKSVNIKDIQHNCIDYRYIDGRKKRVFFDYDLKEFFDYHLCSR